MIDYTKTDGLIRGGRTTLKDCRSAIVPKIKGYGPHKILRDSGNLKYEDPDEFRNLLYKYHNHRRVMAELRKSLKEPVQHGSVRQRLYIRRAKKVNEIFGGYSKAQFGHPSFHHKSFCVEFPTSKIVYKCGDYWGDPSGGHFDKVDPMRMGRVRPGYTLKQPFMLDVNQRPYASKDGSRQDRWTKRYLFLGAGQSKAILNLNEDGRHRVNLVVYSELTAKMQVHLRNHASVWLKRFIYFDVDGEKFESLADGVRLYRLKFYDFNDDCTGFVSVVCDSQFVYPRLNWGHDNKKLLSGYKRAKQKDAFNKMGV